MRLHEKINKTRTFRGYKIRFGKPVEDIGRYWLLPDQHAQPSSLRGHVKIDGGTFRVTFA